MFYAKLALGNLRKNRRAYLPFLISMLFLVAVNTVTQIIINNPGMQKLPQADSALMMFNLGSVIILIFTVIFSLYTNSFLLKQRKKELGLYNVLGLGKRELYKLMSWESLFSFLFVLMTGLLTGVILGKLSFLVLRKMMELDTGFDFNIPIGGFLTVGGIFAVIFLLLFLINCLQIARTDPIQLLHGSKTGEKIPKSRWLTAILGLVCVGTGYIMALRIESPIEAMIWFFVAVILVVIGTYCLFDAGSIVFLKMLKKQRDFYYQTNHFINVSSMIYRMKQNAAGLASICILSTMVLVTVATTASLYVGQQESLDTTNPQDIMLTTEKEPEQLFSAVDQLAQKENITVTDSYRMTRSAQLMFTKQGTGKFSVVNALEYDSSKIASGAAFVLTDLADYQKITGRSLTLTDDEVLLLTQQGEEDLEKLQLGDARFRIKENIPGFAGYQRGDTLTDTYVVIMKDWEHVIQPLLDKWYSGKDFIKSRTPVYTWDFNFSAKDSQKRLSFGDAVEKLIVSRFGGYDEGYSVSSRDTRAQGLRSFTGGFFFLGIIFGVTFTMATALIIYYKQISEGLDDQERFAILQKVGMSHQEVKKVIASQILMVFAFPLIAAVLHLSVAFNMIRKLLLLFGLVDWHLFLIVTAIVVLIFALLYYLVYRITAKGYYRIVER